MEELQSTEVLEREILDDARKKALRILKTADETVSAKTAEWSAKTAESIAEIKENYNKQKKQAAEKVMVRLPIDKLRTKAERIENLIKEAMKNWYENTSRPMVIQLLTDELSKRLDICKGIRTGVKKKACFSGIDHKDAETILKKADLDAELEEVKSADPYPVITIETNNTRIIASIQTIIDFYLAEKRQELAEALVGHDFMENL